MFYINGTRIILFLIYLILSTNLSLAQNDIKGKIEDLLKDPFFEKSFIALSAYDLTAGKNIVDINSKKLMHPASNQKIITSAAGLLYLGPDYEFTTSFYYSGNVIDSICYGDLYIVGGGDPDLSINELDSLTASIKSSGIKAFTGNLYGDVSLMDSTYWGEGWMWDDAQGTSAPYLSPLIVNDASVKIYYSPGKVGEPVKIKMEPENKYIKILNHAITIDTDTTKLKIKRGWISRSNQILVEGTIKSFDDGGFEELTIYKPEYFFLNLLTELLEKNNILFAGKADTLTLPKNAKLILTHSRKLKDILPNLNKESDNLSAEMVLIALGFKEYGKPTNTIKNTKILYKLASDVGLNPNDYRFSDGSGLSHYNLVNAFFITELLRYLYLHKNDLFKILIESFPIAGIDGTLEQRMKNGPAYNNVKAKTGTLSGVSTLSGYLNTKNKHLIAFSIMIQNYIDGTKTARLMQDEICRLLSEIN